MAEKLFDLAVAGYVCDKCNLRIEDVPVRWREPEESVRDYIDAVAAVCCTDHGLRSPYCTAKELMLSIPITSEGVGSKGAELTPEEVDDLNRMLKGNP